MTSPVELADFAENLQQEVLQLAAFEDDESFIPQSFTALVTDMLAEAGEVGDADPCYFRKHGMEVSAYGFDPDEGRLNLFVSIHTAQTPPATVTRDRVETAFQRMRTFLGKAVDGLYTDLEEASSPFDMALQIHQMAGDLSHVRLYLLTDGRTTLEFVPPGEHEGYEITYHVWDIERLHRLHSSGSALDPITVDFEAEFGHSLPCLPVLNGDAGYDAYLLLVPGSTLASVYDRYGPRLLESNVRTFLQARGKVNRGIRDTIRSEPAHFFAFNNGLTLTASAVDVTNGGGPPAITRMADLQIVNGGQTTASIFTAARRDKVEIDEVHVAAKLIVIHPDISDELVRRVSRYSNTQNRVTEADFSTNAPFHIELEKLSRSIWAPAVDGGQHQTRWFYERSRGQYQDQKNREVTPGKKKQFNKVHPTSQKFTKTDVAKFEHAWAQLPHSVSRGAQKNYAIFFSDLSERGGLLPDEDYFSRLVAKAILFRSTEKIVSTQKFGGYRANIVAYTIAVLSNLTAQRVDLDRIWKEQKLSPALADTLEDLCKRVQPILVDPPGGRNVTEWTKLEKCWETVKEEIECELTAELQKELLARDRARKPRKRTGVEVASTTDQKNIDQVSAVAGEKWFELAAWAKQTSNLQPWQRSLAFNLGKRLKQNLTPTPRQAKQGVIIMEEAARLGFDFTSAENQEE